MSQKVRACDMYPPDCCTVGSSAAVRRVHATSPYSKNMVATQYNSEYNVR